MRGDDVTERSAEIPGEQPRPSRWRDAARVWFALTFVGIAAALFGLYFFPYAENGVSEAWLTRYLEGYARVVGTVLGVLEPNIVVSHKEIVGRFSMTIVRSCDGMEANILFCSA